MSEEIAETNGLLIALAHVRTDLEMTRAVLAQAERATAAERVARMRVEADAAWWHATVANYVTSATVEDRAMLRGVLVEALAVDHPGAALLAELDAARAFIRVISRAALIGGWSDEESALLRAYEAAAKAREA